MPHKSLSCRRSMSKYTVPVKALCIDGEALAGKIEEKV